MIPLLLVLALQASPSATPTQDEPIAPHPHGGSPAFGGKPGRVDPGDTRPTFFPVLPIGSDSPQREPGDTWEVCCDGTRGASGSLPVGGMPASSGSAEPGAEGTLEILADRIEVDLDAEVLSARGNVRTTYLDYHLHAGELWYDARHDRGQASGGIKLRVRGYALETDRFEFDIRNEQALAGPWNGYVAGRGRFTGEFLFLSPGYAYASRSTYSPCLSDDPGYYLSSEKFEWFPFGGKQHFEGKDVVIHVSGASLARVPSFRASMDPRQEEIERQRGGRAVDTKVGYNAYEGAFATGTGKFSVAEGHTGTLPIRLTQGRGLSVGTTQTYQWNQWSFTGDATYQTYFRGGSTGPRANLGAVTALPGGPSLSLGLGYRTEIAGIAVHRLPELTLGYPTVPLGPFSLGVTSRMGYLLENLVTKTAEDSNPFSMDTEEIKTRGFTVGHRAVLSPPPWRPNSFWESQVYLGGSVSSYLLHDEKFEMSRQGEHQAALSLGLRNTQWWNPILSTQIGFEANRKQGESPFVHDRLPANDLISAGATFQLTPRWSTSIGTLYYRTPDGIGFKQNDVTFRVAYSAPCLSWAVSLQVQSWSPFTPAISFDYHFGTP